MDANTVIAICSVVIAVASLAVSAYVAWATRKHNRLCVHSRGAGNWRQLMAGSGGSQGLPAMALAMASSAVMPWAAAESR